MPKTIIESYPDFDRRVNPDEPFLNVSEFFMDTIQGENLVGYPAAFLRLQNCTQSCIWCFQENTLISTLHGGKKKIKDVKVGDVLITLDEKENIVQTTVKEVMVRRANIKDEIYRIKTNDKISKPTFVTKEHPIYVKGKGWTKVQDINVGDTIISTTGSQVSSYGKTHFNPMKDKSIAKKMADSYKGNIKSGLIVPYKRTAELNKSNSERLKGDKNPMKNPEVVKKASQNCFKGKTKLEEKYEKFFIESNLPITFIGNNKLAVGDSKTGYKFPDFIVNDKMKLIEVYDTTFPFYSEGGYRTVGEYETKKAAHHNKFGYETLFLTEKDFGSEGLQEKLFNFAFNGSIVESISNNLSGKQYAGAFESTEVEEAEVYNLSCFPYNTYLADNMWVHNCDTSEVWRRGNPYTLDELMSYMHGAGLFEKLCNGQHLVLTGGSPVLQQENLVLLLQMIRNECSKLPGHNPIFEIENECTIMPSIELIDQINIWNNSPKLASSKNPKALRYRPEVISRLAALKNSWFKFVVSKEEDWNEIVSDFGGLIPKSRIVLMPMGATREELEQTRMIAVELAVKHGVRYSTREHIVLWDKKTGV